MISVEQIKNYFADVYTCCQNYGAFYGGSWRRGHSRADRVAYKKNKGKTVMIMILITCDGDANNSICDAEKLNPSE